MAMLMNQSMGMKMGSNKMCYTILEDLCQCFGNLNCTTNPFQDVSRCWFDEIWFPIIIWGCLHVLLLQSEVEE